MSVTLQQIADLAGVHKSTVYKVIHNRPGVSDAKRREIQELLKEYHYESNPLATALNYQKSKLTVAVVLPRVDAEADLKRGIEMMRQDFNSFNVQVDYYEMDYSDAEKQAACLRQLRGDRVSGIVLLPIESPLVRTEMEKLRDAGIPVVTINSDLSDAPRLCYVGQNMEQSGKTAAHLFEMLLPEKGTIGMISSHNMSSIREREEAFCRYLPTLGGGLEVADTALIREEPEPAYLAASEMLRKHPDMQGLFITCGCVEHICRAVVDSGRAGKLIIICFECYPEIVRLVKTDVVTCTLSGDLSGQGRIAMRVLFEYLIYKTPPQKQIIYTQNPIFIRENISV